MPIAEPKPTLRPETCGDPAASRTAASATTSLCEWALRYASWGYPVFPLVPLTKTPITGNGFHDASCDPKQIDEWWGRNPNANIGIPTNRLLVLDIDGKNNAWLAAQADRHIDLATGRIARTPRGGTHYFFKQPDCVDVRNSAGDIAENVDIRANGGYVAVFPSVTADGAYGWIDGAELDCPPDRLATAPDWLTNLALDCKKKKSVAGTVGGDRILEGRRNSTLTSLAGSMRRRGMTGAEIAVALHQVNKDRCEPPLEADEVSKIVKSIGTRPAGAATVTATAQADHGDRPEILIDTEEHRVGDQAIAALANDRDVYQRAGQLVRVVCERSEESLVRRGSSPVIVPIDVAHLRDRLTANIRFLKARANGIGPAHPPPWLAPQIMARRKWEGVPVLNSVSTTPVLRPDGSILQSPGYDSVTGVFYLPSQEFPPIAAAPTLEEATAAAAELLEVIEDCLFENDAHRVAWLACVLTPLARPAFEGPSPLFLFDANTRGAGKTLLARAAGRIVLGHDVPVTGYSHDAEELRKLITSVALAGDVLVVFDNVTEKLGNATLDRALTATCWGDRLLGKNEKTYLPLRTTWLATGNNVVVGGDTARRIVHCRLQVLQARPEDRDNFKHPDLLGWVSSRRGRLVVAGLTILRAYFLAGRPRAQLSPFGGFEGWSDLVRQALVWVGLPDTCSTRENLALSADSTEEALAQLINAWRQYVPAGEGLVMAHALAKLYGSEDGTRPMDSASVAMRAAIENLVGCPAGKTPMPRQVGNKLKGFRQRVIDNLMLDSDPKESIRDGAVWRLIPSSSRESACHASLFTPSNKKNKKEDGREN